VATRGSSSAAVALGQAPEILHDHRAVIPEASGAPVTQPSQNAPARPIAGDGVRPSGQIRSGDRRGDLRSAIRAQRIEAALDLGEANPANAIARYYDIAAHKSGEEASQAFYSIAVLRHLKQAQHAEALQTLDAYLRRFPGGKEYRAALWLRVRILCLDRIDDRCRAAAYTYLHEDPHGPAARVAELITLSE
jgi:TolA-binding protein